MSRRIEQTSPIKIFVLTMLLVGGLLCGAALISEPLHKLIHDSPLNTVPVTYTQNSVPESSQLAPSEWMDITRETNNHDG